ncbi:OsmC family protein [Botryobacter ruber]|uniref:OsmC family protein n=1 Tax=Botryobacter ruber TaxID=2171629 RepID=UPI000E0A38EE|nr:OsmC family protein [Botryobacter ruber]
MQVELNRVNDFYHFEAKGTAGVTIHIDGSPEIGGVDAGARPMELLLMGLGGCSAIDIIQILKKQRQQVESFKISVDASRVQGQVPSLFENIVITYRLSGPNLDKEKVRKAIDLSMEKYCSVSAILEKTASISYDFEVTQTAADVKE